MEVQKVLQNPKQSKLSILRTAGRFLYPGVNASPLTGWEKYKLAPVTVLSPLAASAAGVLSGSVAS